MNCPHIHAPAEVFFVEFFLIDFIFRSTIGSLIDFLHLVILCEVSLKLNVRPYVFTL